MRINISFVFLLFLSATNSNAQLKVKQFSQIDSLFLDWNIPNHPGGAVGVMYQGELIFSKAYGLASLEYLVPNNPSTLFNIASVSKQFTAMGIVVMEQQGKLAFDDDIRKYLPELPDFGETVTIRHMLHHTSGLRSLHALLALAGWRGDDARTNADLDRFLLDQNGLNFKPGDEYLYCNTGYMLMANIIERISEEEFPTWMKANIFEPLGMYSTYVEDDYSRVVPNNATSYYGRKLPFDRAVEYWGYVGSGNMHANTADLLKWLEYFRKPKEGWTEHFKILQTLTPFNDGTKNDYAFGIGISEYNGYKGIGHGGSIGGYRSNVVTYPDAELSIVVLTNYSNGAPGQKVRKITNIILGDEAMDLSKPTIQTIDLSPEQLAMYEGDYWNDQSNYSRRIYIKDDTLRYARSENNEDKIVPIGQDVFQMVDVPANVIIQFDIDGSVPSMTTTVNQDLPAVSTKYVRSKPSLEELEAYAGNYYSPELNTYYSIRLDDNVLICHHTRHGDLEVERIKEDVLECDWPVNIAKIQRDDSGKINGMMVSNGRVRNLWFEKL